MALINRDSRYGEAPQWAKLSVAEQQVRDCYIGDNLSFLNQDEDECLITVVEGFRVRTKIEVEMPVAGLEATRGDVWAQACEKSRCHRQIAAGWRLAVDDLPDGFETLEIDFEAQGAIWSQLVARIPQFRNRQRSKRDTRYVLGNPSAGIAQETEGLPFTAAATHVSPAALRAADAISCAFYHEFPLSVSSSQIIGCRFKAQPKAAVSQIHRQKATQVNSLIESRLEVVAL